MNEVLIWNHPTPTPITAVRGVTSHLGYPRQEDEGQMRKVCWPGSTPDKQGHPLRWILRAGLLGQQQEVAEWRQSQDLAPPFPDVILPAAQPCGRSGTGLPQTPFC